MMKLRKEINNSGSEKGEIQKWAKEKNTILIRR